MPATEPAPKKSRPPKDRLTTRTARAHTLHRRRGHSGFATTFIQEPTDFLEMDHGSLYLVIEVPGDSRAAAEVSELICRVIRDEYYSDLNRDPLASFEESLQRLNEELADYASSGHLGWVGHLSTVIAILSGRSLHLTSLGSARAYLLRAKRLTDISDGLSGEGPPNPLKTFQNIASGNLTDKDLLIIATESLFGVVGESELSKLSSELSPARTLDRLRPELERNPRLERLGTVLIELLTEQELARQYVETEAPLVEIDRTKGLPSSLRSAAPAALEATRRSWQIGRGITSRATSSFHSSRLLAGSLASRLKGSKPKQDQESPSPTPDESLSPDEAPPESPPTPPRSPRSLPAFLRQRGRLRLIAISALLVVALLLGITWYFASVKGREQSAIEQSNSLERQVQAALVLKDQAKALKLIREAELTLEPALASGDEGRRAAAGKLLALLGADRDQIQSVTRLIGLNPLADLSGVSRSLRAVGLVRTPDGLLYSADSRTGALYRLSGSTPETAAPGQGLGVRTLTLESDGVIAALLKPSGVAELTSEGVTRPKLSIGEWPASVDLTSFANFLYLLDPSKGRVWKIPKTVGGFGKAQDYLGNEDDQRIVGARSLAIDSSIYILQSSGEIWKFDQGVRTAFTLSGLPQKISRDSSLFIREGFSSLYILDRDSGRIVLTTPAGAYQRSLAGEFLKGAQSLWVDEPGKTAWVLSDNKIYQLGL